MAQTITIAYTGQVPGYVSWYATTNYPTRGKTETSGSASGSMEYTPEWVLQTQVAPEFGYNPDTDTVYLNNVLYHSPTPAPTTDGTLNVTIEPAGSGSLHVFINHTDRGSFNAANFSLHVKAGDYFEMYADPASGYVFSKYIQPNGQETYDKGFAANITTSGIKNIKAVFVSAPPPPPPSQAWIEVYLNPTKNGQVTITQGSYVSPAFDISFARNFDIGTAITVRATPYEGYKFKEWQIYVNGALFNSSPNNPASFTVEKPYTVKAIFESDLPPPPACKDGTTRTVKCPKNGLDVPQICTGGKWINKNDKDCQSMDAFIVIIVLIVIFVLILFLGQRRK